MIHDIEPAEAVDELEHWGKTDVQIETASTHYANDPNIPHKSDDPDDVGVVVYYRDLEARADEQSAIACDQWKSQRENARAISLWVRRVRLADRCHVETARGIDEIAQLTPADEEAIAARGVSKDKLTPSLRAFQLRRRILRKPGREALKDIVQTVL